MICHVQTPQRRYELLERKFDDTDARMKEEREEKVIQSSDDEFEDNDDNYSSDEDRKGEQKVNIYVQPNLSVSVFQVRREAVICSSW